MTWPTHEHKDMQMEVKSPEAVQSATQTTPTNSQASTKAADLTANRPMDEEAKSILSPEMLEVLGIDVKSEKASDESETNDDESSSNTDNEDAEKMFDELMGKDTKEKDEESETDNLETESEKELYKLIHDGKEVSVPKSEMMELAQKGYDYTQKTMALADQRKKFEAEKQATNAEMEKAYQEVETAYKEQDSKLNALKMWDTIVESMKVEDPDLFNMIKDYSQRSSVRFNNPLLDNKIKSLEQRLAQYENKGKEDTQKQIVESYHKELSTFQDQVKPILTKLNFMPDYKKVEDMWASDPTGKMTVQQAFYAVYGDDVMKLQKSKESLLQSKKSIKKPSLPSGTGKQTSGDKSLKGINYNDITKEILRRYA